MQIVIDIPEEAYEIIKKDTESEMYIIQVIKQGIPLDDIKAEILEEKDFAYADFEQYKVDILGVDSEYVEDELPYDDFRYGMERCLEILNKYTGK